MSEEKKLTQDVTSDKNHWPTWLLGFFLPVVKTNNRLCEGESL